MGHHPTMKLLEDMEVNIGFKTFQDDGHYQDDMTFFEARESLAKPLFEPLASWWGVRSKWNVFSFRKVPKVFFFPPFLDEDPLFFWIIFLLFPFNGKKLP